MAFSIESDWMVSTSFSCSQYMGHILKMVMVMYLYTAHIPIWFMAVNNSIIGIGIGRGWDRTSACKVSVHSWSHPPNACIHLKEGQKAWDNNTGNSVPYSFRFVCGFFNVPQFMNKGCETGGTYHLHGNTGNSSWKIKWITPFHLGSFREYGLWFEMMLFFCSFTSL